MLKVIKEQLQKIINDIDSGNSNIEKEDMESLTATLVRIHEQKLSKYQAMEYLNCKDSKFDKLVRLGKLPQGRKQIGFKELFWYKSDIDKYIKESKK